MQDYKQSWYETGNKNYSNLQKSLNGILDGQEYLNKVDIDCSYQFLEELFQSLNIFKKQSDTKAIDCGTGIGRITKYILKDFYQTTDILDQSQAWLAAAKLYLQKEISDKQINNIFQAGLQKYMFSQPYDCIWMQWVLCHLFDDDFVRILKLAKLSLKNSTTSFIIVKEEIAENFFDINLNYYYITRTVDQLKELFLKAGLKVIKEIFQTGFPEHLFKGKIFALQPMNEQIE